MVIKKISAVRSLAILLLSTSILAGCSSGLQNRDSFFSIGHGGNARVDGVGNISAQEAVNFLSEPPITVLETSTSNSLDLRTDLGEKVPDLMVGEINATPMAFGAVLNKVSDQVGMSWEIEDDDDNTLMNKNVNIVRRSDTSLKSVLDSLSSLTGSFYAVHGDQITFSKEKQFILRVPRMADSQEVLSAGLTNLGAKDVFTDKLSGTISFTASRSVFKNVRRLIASFEEGRDMVVYDVWIIDRQIGDDVGAGLSITGKDKKDESDSNSDSSSNDTSSDTSSDGNSGSNSGTTSLLSSGSTDTDSDNAVTLGGAGLISAIAKGASLDGFTTGTVGNMSVKVAASFLRSLGKAETVARPTISMLSGGESEFKSGSSREYIREVTTNTDDDGDVSDSTDTQTLETGVNVKVSGSHHGGVISSDFEIEVNEFIQFEEFDTGDVALRLPETTQRTLTAHLEARPGDVMILGGIIRNKEILGGTELIGLGIPISRSKEMSKSETILLVRPRLVQIRPIGQKNRSGTTFVEEGIGFKPVADNPIEGVLQDEKKARGLLGKLK